LPNNLLLIGGRLDPKKTALNSPCDNTRLAHKSTESRSVEGLDIQQAIDLIRDQLEQDEAALQTMRASIESI
jgi:hypothetical protein